MHRPRWRGRLAVGIAALAVCVFSLSVLTGPLASAARADTYTDYLVQQLRHDPVYISSYSPMAQPGDAAQLQRTLARIPLKTYVVADVAAGPDGDTSDSDLAAQLHDQLGGGLFIISRRIGDVSATGYGTSLDVDDAMQAAQFQLPAGYPTLPQVTRKFVTIALSGHIQQQLTIGEQMSEKADKADEPAATPAWEILSAAAGGTVLGGGAILALAWQARRRRRARRWLAPGPGNGGPGSGGPGSGGHGRHPGPRGPGAGVAGTLGVAALLALSPAAVTHAVAGRARPGPTRAGLTPPGQAAAPTDGAPVVARGLSTAPLYVDPDMQWMFTPAEQKKISAALRSSPVRVFAAAVPLSTDEDSPDYASYLSDQLYRGTRRDGVYLIVGPSGEIYDAEYNVPRDIDMLDAPVTEPDTQVKPAQIAASVPGRLAKVIAVIGKSPKDPEAAALPSPEYTPGEFTGGRDASDDDVNTPPAQSDAAADMTGGGVAGLVALGPLLALLGLGGARIARRTAADRRGWGDDGDAGTPVGRMPAAPSAGWLRRHAAGELAALERLIDAAGDTNPGWERALDDYDAGRLAAADDAEPIDLAGAIVLARDGRMALDKRLAKPPSPCLVNPLHGRATAALPAQGVDLGADSGRAFGRIPGGQVPVCDACKRAGASVRRGRVLKVPHGVSKSQHGVSKTQHGVSKTQHGGVATAYFGLDSVWSERLFGATGPGLPQAVREHLGVN